MNEAGQLIMTGIQGTVLTDDEKLFLEKENIGGVIFFTKNYESPAQLAELVNNIQQCRTELPLFIGVDHEGGRVFRFKKNFTQFPPMMELSKLESPKNIFYSHKIMAEELALCGVNLNFSPCTDVLTNPNNKVIGDRAFGSDAESVSKFVTAAIRGLQTHGVIACAKHFPGHGSTSKDSHDELPYVKRTIEELRDVDLIPFSRAIKSSRVEMIMMGHLVVDCIDPTLPCSLSQKAHEFLRDEMKFEGIICSDDMQMKAITDHHGVEEAAVSALLAGTDLLLYRDMSEAKKALVAVKEALKIKRIKNDDLKLKLKRLTKCKREYFKEYKPIYIPEIANKIGMRGTQIFVEEMVQKISELGNKQKT